MIVLGEHPSPWIYTCLAIVHIFLLVCNAFVLVPLVVLFCSAHLNRCRRTSKHSGNDKVKYLVQPSAILIVSSNVAQLGGHLAGYTQSLYYNAQSDCSGAMAFNATGSAGASLFLLVFALERFALSATGRALGPTRVFALISAATIYLVGLLLWFLHVGIAELDRARAPLCRWRKGNDISSGLPAILNAAVTVFAQVVAAALYARIYFTCGSTERPTLRPRLGPEPEELQPPPHVPPKTKHPSAASVVADATAADDSSSSSSASSSSSSCCESQRQNGKMEDDDAAPSSLPLSILALGNHHRHYGGNMSACEAGTHATDTAGATIGSHKWLSHTMVLTLVHFMLTLPPNIELVFHFLKRNDVPASYLYIGFSACFGLSVGLAIVMTDVSVQKAAASIFVAATTLYECLNRFRGLRRTAGPNVAHFPTAHH